MKVFLTGRPGSGKSTVFQQIVEGLRQNGLRIGGIVTPEVRKDGKRIGFEVLDLASGKKGILATTRYKTKHRLGKYSVDLEDFERVALPALENALKNSDVVCVDELGKMELMSKAFKQKVGQLLQTDKHLLVVVHRSYARKFGRYGILFEVTLENREKLAEQILEMLLKSL